MFGFGLSWLLGWVNLGLRDGGIPQGVPFEYDVYCRIVLSLV